VIIEVPLDAMNMLKRVRLEKGLSQRTVAKRLSGLGYPDVVSRWEKGKNAPTLTSFIAWTQVLGVRVEMKEEEDG
jgi:transcriptional regulator with XRE-family HTH domain